MPDAAAIAEFKARGLCIACGAHPARKKPPAFKCPACLKRASADKIAAQKANPEAHAAAQRADRERRKKFGVCVQCEKLAEPNRTRCEEHLLAAREIAKKRKKLN